MTSKQYSAKYVYPSDQNDITPEYQQELTATRVSYDCSNPYKYTFGGELTGKDVARQQAIVDTICYMGWMSLKDSDHNVSGINAAACKRILREATETRAAAEVLLNAGIITVIGEWSNGIRVGAGPQFVHVDHSAATKIALDTYEKNQTRKPTYAMADYDYEHARMEEALRESFDEEHAGEGCDMRYADGACCAVTYANTPLHTASAAVVTERYFQGIRWFAVMLNDEEIAVYPCRPDAQRRADALNDNYAPTPSKPHYRVPLSVMRAYHGLSDDADAIADAAVAAITGEEYRAPTFVAPAYVAPAFVAAPMPAPTPIRPSEHYTPRVGDTISVIYRHENGTTTTRLVDVQRVGPALFRGYDRTYGRVRNFEYRHVASITIAGKEAVA